METRDRGKTRHTSRAYSIRSQDHEKPCLETRQVSRDSHHWYLHLLAGYAVSQMTLVAYTCTS